MNCKDIIVEYLKTNGYDGLFSRDGECACKMDDLMPCEGYGSEISCEPGYIKYYTECTTIQSCGLECAGETDGFCISAKKPDGPEKPESGEKREAAFCDKLLIQNDEYLCCEHWGDGRVFDCKYRNRQEAIGCEYFRESAR